MKKQIDPELWEVLSELRISKDEVASWVFPTLSSASRKRSLRRYLGQCVQLQRQLEAMGYNPNQHYFTGEQALIINDWFVGELCPEEAMRRLNESCINHLIQKCNEQRCCSDSCFGSARS